MYRMHSREKQRDGSVSKERNVSQNQLKDHSSLPELKVGAQNNLRQKYSDRIYNPNNKYLSKDYSSIKESAKKNLINQRRIIIDPTNNAQKLEQILGNKVNASRDSMSKKYQPLSENYRGVQNKLSIQAANPSSNYHLIGRGGSRGNISSITPHSGRKDNILISRLKENYKNANLSKHGYYVPPIGLRKAANLSSQRSQPVLSNLRNNLAKKYVSNQYSLDHGNPRAHGQGSGIINHK